MPCHECEACYTCQMNVDLDHSKNRFFSLDPYCQSCQTCNTCQVGEMKTYKEVQAEKKMRHVSLWDWLRYLISFKWLKIKFGG